VQGSGDSACLLAFHARCGSLVKRHVMTAVHLRVQQSPRNVLQPGSVLSSGSHEILHHAVNASSAQALVMLLLLSGLQCA
jgi:hypothetical protein